jgi:hypothetical protein
VKNLENVGKRGLKNLENVIVHSFDNIDDALYALAH